jgi:hypothetical protein
MAQDSSDLAGRIATAFDELATAANNLNTVSDELSRSVGNLDNALKKLNLGVSTWVRLSRTEDSHGTFALKELGYAKVGGRWGLALRTVAGHGLGSDLEEREEWLFNDAPRPLRVQAIDMIPELLERLVRDARNTTRVISRKIRQAERFDLSGDTPRSTSTSRK